MMENKCSPSGFLLEVNTETLSDMNIRESHVLTPSEVLQSAEIAVTIVASSLFHSSNT